MAGNMKLELLISATGGQKTIAELLAIQAALNKAAKESAGMTGLANAMGGTYAQAKRLSEGLGMSAEKATAAVQRLKELNAVNADAVTKFATLNKELGITAQEFQKLDQAAQSTQTGMGGVAAVSGAIAATIGGTFAVSSKQAADFNKEMQTFGVITNSLKTEGFAEVRAEVERLAAATSKSPQEIAALATELGRAGFSAEQTKEALAGVVQSSEATGEGLVRTGEVIGSTLNQFGLAATDSTKIADLLTQASNVSASGTNDLGEALSYVGAQAKASNQSVEDTVTTLALLANSGIKGSSAGTGLAEALRRIKVASATASTELDELRSKGTKTAVAAFEKLSGEVRNADGSLKPFPQILATVKESLGTLSQGDQDLMMNALFGVQGGRVIQSLLVQSDEKVKQVTDSMGQFEGSAAKASAQMQQGLGPSLKVLEGSAQLAGIKIGEVVNVGILPLVQGATMLINSFLALPAPVQSALIAMTGIVGVLAAATAAIAAYNLANGARIVAETRAAAATLAGSGGLLAQKVLLLANTQLTVGLVAAKIAQAVASGKVAAAQAIANAAMAAGTITASGLAAATLAVVAPMAALAGAVGLIYMVKLTADMKAANDELDQLAKNSTASMNEFGQIAGRVKGLNNAFKDTGKFTEEQQRLAAGYIKISKDKIKSLEEEIAAAKAVKPATDEQKAAQEALIGGLEAQKQALTNQTAELEKNLASTRANTAAKGDGTKAAEKSKEAIEAETAALQKQREVAKRAAEEANQDKETKISRQQDDTKSKIEAQNDAAREQRQRAADDAKMQRERQFEAQKNKAEASFKREQENRASTFNGMLESRQSKFDFAQQKKQAKFDQSREAAARAFQQRQQESERAFQKEIEDRKKAQQDSFSQAEKLALAGDDPEAKRKLAEEQRINSQIQNMDLTNVVLNPEAIVNLAKQLTGIATATTDEEKQRLQETIRKLQEQQQSQQAQADKAATDQFNQNKQAEESAFKAQQQEAERKFKEEMEVKENTFNRSQEGMKATFEKGQQEKEAAFKAQQQAKEQQFKDAEIAKERTFKDSEKAIETQNKQSILALERKWQDEKLTRERAFNAEQRQLDEASAARIAALKKSGDAKPAPKPPGKRYGGAVKGGQMYEVGESGREFFVAPSNGHIINSWQAAKIARDALTAQQTAALMPRLVPVSVGSVAPTQPNLDRRFQALESQIRRLGDSVYALAYTPRNLTIQSPTPQTDAIKYSRELQRQMLTARGL